MNSRFLRRFLRLGLALAILATPLTTYPAKADSGEDANSLTGSWRINLHFTTPVVADLLALGAFTKEGTFIGSLQGDSAGPGADETPGYGAWTKAGARDFALRFQTVQANADSSLRGVLTVTMQLTLDAKSNQFSGTFQAQSVDPKGNVVFTVGGTLTATRILVECPNINDGNHCN